MKNSQIKLILKEEEPTSGNIIINGKDTTMARPIKETPILTGKDAERFISEMQRVENLSKEVRTSNREKLMKLYNAAKKRITICM